MPYTPTYADWKNFPDVTTPITEAALDNLQTQYSLAVADVMHITSGQYTGNDTANRAIAHGLGVAPKLVLIMGVTGSPWFRILNIQAYISYDHSAVHAVTAPNATNFYVGNATSYANSANANAIVYDWVAIG